MNDERNFLVGLSFFIGAGQFITCMMLASAIAPNYNFNTASISALGTFPSTAMLFNISLISFGILNILGGYLYYLDHERTGLFLLYVIGGIGGIGAGIFPLNTTDLHSLFALLAFLFFNLEAIFTSRILSGAMKYIALLAGIIGLIYLIIMIIGDAGFTAVFGAIGHNGSERMIAYPAILWLISFGGYLLGQAD